MSKKVTLVLTILLWVLIAISAVLSISMLSNIDAVIAGTGDSYVNTNICWAYALCGFGVIAAFGFSAYQSVTSGKQAVKTFGSIAAFAVIALIAWACASEEIPVFHNSDQLVEEGKLTANVAKVTDTLLYLTYFLFGGAIFAIIYSSASRLWR